MLEFYERIGSIVVAYLPTARDIYEPTDVLMRMVRGIVKHWSASFGAIGGTTPTDSYVLDKINDAPP